MKQTIEVITPEKAEKYLLANKGNRAMRAGVAEKYAADMAAGRWTECLAPIAFYSDGEVADGQHRLWAIIESGSEQTFIVVRDFPREAGLNVDTGLTRSLVDNAKISGDDKTLSNTLIAVAKGIEDGDSSGMRKSPRSNAETLATVERHRAAAEWVVHNAPVGRGLRNAPVMSALGRAWYSESDKDRLGYFSKVVSKGITNNGDEDSAAIALRNYLQMKLVDGVALTTSMHWRDTFLKAQNAIRYFMLRKPLRTIRVVSDEAYPICKTTNPRHAPRTREGQQRANKAAKEARQ